ncbi:protein LATERAL ORGAN BOUNDARIES isoform X2 [Asparagus officinalis]|nr:protein LATERAL ORGAN BOUNDARIES isoform X2 [Asparagus officinalis]
MPGCIFAPYFPPEEPQKFINVHKIFGASNVTKILNDLLPHQREDAVNSLAYEAEARIKDPVYGCVGAISVLQREVQRLQKELEAANADLLRLACGDIPSGFSLPMQIGPQSAPPYNYQPSLPPHSTLPIPYNPHSNNPNPDSNNNTSTPHNPLSDINRRRGGFDIP